LCIGGGGGRFGGEGRAAKRATGHAGTIIELASVANLGWQQSFVQKSVTMVTMFILFTIATY